MSTKVKFGNKNIQLPGTYARIIAGQNNPPRDLDYGKLLIIDNCINGSSVSQQAMGGAGVNGTLSKGKNAIYSFKDINSFRDFVSAGWWWKAAQYLFNPDGNGQGVSEVLYVKPATTKPANMWFGAGGNNPTNGGTFSIKTLDESLQANGVTDETPAYVDVQVIAAGTAGNTITLQLFGQTLATYTVITSDTVALVVAGLAASMTSLGIAKVKTSTSPDLVFYLPKGYGASGNGLAINILTTGTVGGTISSAAAHGVSGTTLTSGYGYTIEAGVQNSSAWVFKIWRGDFKGNYTDNYAYDMVTSANSTPVLMAKSTECLTIQDLINWANTDSTFGSKFVLDSTNSSSVGTGVILASDVTNIPSYFPAVGATEVYNAMDATLTAITDLNYNYVIYTTNNISGTTTIGGVSYTGTQDPYTDTNVLKILTHLRTVAKYDKFLALAIPTSVATTGVGAICTEFNSEKVNLVFDSILERSQYFASGFRVWDSFYHTCAMVGRVLGLAPEVPATFKTLAVDGVKTPLTEIQKEVLDEAGCLCTYYDEDFGEFVVLHDVNTLQDNDFVLTNSGTSHLIQVARIKSQLNKELIINSKLDLLSDPAGVNRNSLTVTDAVEWTKGYLQRKVGNLIVEYRNVTATLQGDVIFVDYEAMPNSEIKGIFFTGRIYL